MTIADDLILAIVATGSTPSSRRIDAEPCVRAFDCQAGGVVAGLIIECSDATHCRRRLDELSREPRLNANSSDGRLTSS
jgi:hypothetical protein